jgi:hypothetical protein
LVVLPLANLIAASIATVGRSVLAVIENGGLAFPILRALGMMRYQ